MSTNGQKTSGFDPQKLNEMAEPLQVHIEREVNGNQTEQIPVPAINSQTGALDPDGPAGAYWTKDGIRKLSWWLRDFWTGGGSYRVTVTDANGNQMAYRFVIPTKDYPQRQPPAPSAANVPPPSVASAVPPAAPQQQPMLAPPGGIPQNVMQQAPVQHQQAQQPQGTLFQWGTPVAPPQLPPVWASNTPVHQPAPQQPWGAQPQNPWYAQPQNPWAAQPQNPWAVQPQNPWGWQAPPQSVAAPSSREEDRLKKLEEELQAAKLEKKALEYKQELNAMQAAHERSQNEMKEEIRRLGESSKSTESDESKRYREQLDREREERHRIEMQQLRDTIAALAQPKNNPNDDLIRKMEEDGRRRDEDMRRQQEKWEREKEKAEQQRRDDQLRADMKDRELRLEQQMREMNANKGPDPVIEMLKEQSRNNMEHQRQMAEIQRASNEKFAAFMMPPTQLLSLMREGSSSMDQITRTILPAVTGIVDMYRSAANNIAELSGGGQGSWVPGLIQEGLAKAGEIAKNITNYRRDQAVSENKAKIAQAQAQEAAARAQQAMSSRPVAPYPTAAPQYVPPQQQVQQAGGGLNGAAPQAPAPKPSEEARVIPIEGAAKAKEEKGTAKDAERFGPAWESVRRLRKGVDAYCAANKDLVDEDARAVGSDKEPIGASPGQAVDAVLQGIAFIAKAGREAEVPAFRLYQEERWGEFADLLMPNAPPYYKNEVIRIFNEELEQDDEGDEGSDEEQRDPELKA